MELRQRALEAFCQTDPDLKVATTLALDCDDLSAIDPVALLVLDPDQPGRPSQPELVHPQQVPRRSPFSAEGHSALMHSIAHIEFNAANHTPHTVSFHFAEN